MAGIQYFRIQNNWAFKAFKHICWKYHLRYGSTDVLYNLVRRGVVKELFPKDATIKTSGVPCAYAGFDATSDSLHIGNLLVLVALIHWQRAGNQSIVVIGDATARVGDPSGHKFERESIESDIVETNANSIIKSVNQIFENHKNCILSKKYSKEKNHPPVLIVKNSSWYNKMSIIDLMSNAGRHIRVGEMLSRISVKSRMETGDGINFSEFSYQLFQSYDWLHLLKHYNCAFQIGGADQLGNIVTGYQLVTSKTCETVYAALLPIIQSESGDKYGKTAGSAIYLNSNRTSPFDLYQFFLRLPDADVPMFLKLFTFLSTDEIESTIQKHMKNPDGRFGQNKIAEEVLLLVHGQEGLESAKRVTKAFYQSDLASLMKMGLEEIKQILPSSSLVELPFEGGISLMDLALKAKCFLHQTDAHRIITAGGLYINFERMTSPNVLITPGVHILTNGTTLIRIGKKTYYLVIWK